jgi:cellulose biosynthesis protein BcsQ
MALANVAYLFAQEGLKVLIIDFDLEAPGLEQFFQVNKDSIRRKLGLLDLLLNYKQSMSAAAGEEATFKRLDAFITPVYERLPRGGRLNIMTAGQRYGPEQLARYARTLRTFDWQDFYYNWEGELFFEWLRTSLVPAQYDVVLVDSRTG